MIIKINLFILLALLLSGCKNSSSYETVTTSTGEWQLIWNDEFGYTGLPDSTKWSYDTEGNSWGWGNNEAQYYTANDSANAYVKEGVLTITARIDSMAGSGNTSARLSPKRKVTGSNGRFEIRAKLPTGLGTWPLSGCILPTGSMAAGRQR